MEDENEINTKKNAKMARNKISILLIGFYAGLCVISDLAVKYYFKSTRTTWKWYKRNFRFRKKFRRS